MSKPVSLVFLAASVACGGGADASPSPRTPEPGVGSVSAPNATASTAPSESKASANASEANAPAPAAPAPEGWPYGAAPSAEERKALLDKLRADAGPLKTNWSPPGKQERYGHAEGLVAATPEAVRAKLVDFAHYKDLAGPKFKSVKVVDKQGTNTDVYFQLPIMKGLFTIWYVTRFAPARAAAGGDVVEGTFVKGNIKNMHIAFKVLPGPDEKSSVMTCDLLLSPSVPAPQGAVDEELRDACGDAINAVKKQLGN